MQNPWTRREVLAAGGMAGVAAFGGRALSEVASPDAAGTPGPAGDGWPGFPHLDPRLTAEVVGKAHVDEKRVRELVDLHPPLVNAWWDWGFGDWESPLGAASHTGRRSIAEFLLERGARIDIFAAAMLGYTEVVKAFVAARPGVQRLLGPHGIPLLAHAKAGGEQSLDTFKYLQSLGDAGNAPALKTISPEEQQRFIGTYLGDNARMEIRLNSNKALVIAIEGESDRMIFWLGGNEFFPSGVPTTRLAFDFAATPATLTITAGPFVRRAVRQ